ncbi:hypothetical protein F5878DRAFT_666212 [Lentinula raphanica]|uniref:Uncharacterized protein n=1 Tax=Lentinula raphanica TaxID=153919 RepID=A0AA38NY71_9AGAR|nr:hypothetical protein F5878DRAFT_666212 [Lentinula raphanica]
MHAALTKFRVGVVAQVLVLLILVPLLPFCYASPIPSGIAQGAPGASSSASGSSPPNGPPPPYQQHADTVNRPPFRVPPAIVRTGASANSQSASRGPAPPPYTVNPSAPNRIQPATVVSPAPRPNEPAPNERTSGLLLLHHIAYPDYPPNSIFHKLETTPLCPSPALAKEMKQCEKLLKVWANVNDLFITALQQFSMEKAATPEFRQRFGEGRVKTKFLGPKKWYPSFDYKPGDVAQARVTILLTNSHGHLLREEKCHKLEVHWKVGHRSPPSTNSSHSLQIRHNEDRMCIICGDLRSWKKRKEYVVRTPLFTHTDIYAQGLLNDWPKQEYDFDQILKPNKGSCIETVPTGTTDIYDRHWENISLFRTPSLITNQASYLSIDGIRSSAASVAVDISQTASWTEHTAHSTTDLSFFSVSDCFQETKNIPHTQGAGMLRRALHDKIRVQVAEALFARVSIKMLRPGIFSRIFPTTPFLALPPSSVTDSTPLPSRSNLFISITLMSRTPPGTRNPTPTLTPISTPPSHP